jgi:uncharacterized protein (TIGR03435 family)
MDGIPAGRDATLMSLITFACDVQPAHVIGVPDWAKRAAIFEVAARAAGDVPPEQIKLMVHST